MYIELILNSTARYLSENVNIAVFYSVSPSPHNFIKKLDLLAVLFKSISPSIDQPPFWFPIVQ